MNILTQSSMTDGQPSQIVYEDQVHGSILISTEDWDIIQTKEFQRLKNIKQLGGAFLVFPTATHSRYEHCIGTLQVAGDLIENLKNNQEGRLEVEERDKRNVMTAALCHDLGHGPFSHTFDNNFIQVRFPELKWCHERCSVELFEFMIDNNHIDHFEREDIRMIQDFIIGAQKNSKQHLW